MAEVQVKGTGIRAADRRGGAAEPEPAAPRSAGKAQVRAHGRPAGGRQAGRASAVVVRPLDSGIPCPIEGQRQGHTCFGQPSGQPWIYDNGKDERLLHVLGLDRNIHANVHSPL